jgi:hypothetical protein
MGEIWEKRFFFGIGGIPDPPEVVSGFRGGGGVRWTVEPTRVHEWYLGNNLSDPP